MCKYCYPLSLWQAILDGVSSELCTLKKVYFRFKNTFYFQTLLLNYVGKSVCISKGIVIHCKLPWWSNCEWPDAKLQLECIYHKAMKICWFLLLTSLSQTTKLLMFSTPSVNILPFSRESGHILFRGTAITRMNQENQDALKTNKYRFVSNFQGVKPSKLLSRGWESVTIT